VSVRLCLPWLLVPIHTGASLEAHIRALHTLAGIAAEDVLLAAWHNDTFRCGC
jgi:hypothetical protein